MKEHLEDVVRVHATPATSSSTLINLLNIGTIIVHLSLLLVGKYSVSLTDVFELGFGLLLLLFRACAMLIRMPEDGGFTIGFLDL